ncbi:PREDICTED: facilitated trehalose transporter Tret1-like [Papilio xuthus]|uniref:Facilitated trehalose transporter Tret1-like n=1 Tax=Papilio xuthus TaxID=66420 RepID=A0AAJ6ZHA1_PAPXU|nr:PREDICTED: facilitated trehalose transporter Tret1-like [Papilio xuthus]
MVYTLTENKDPGQKNIVVWKQYLISVFVSIPFITHGVENELLNATSHLAPVIAAAHVPWTEVTFLLAALVSAPAHGILIDRHGRRIGIYVLVLLQGMTSVPLLFSTSELSVLVHAAVAGVATGGLFLVLPVYVREVSGDAVRGATLTLMMPMTTLGNAMKLLLTFDQMLFLVLGLVALELLVVFLIPESPAYLVKADKVEDAKVAAAKLMCSRNDDPFVVDDIRKLKEESDRAKANGKLTIFQILKNNIYRDEIKIGLVLNTTMVLSGSSIFLQPEKTLSGLGADVDPRRLLVPLSLLAGAACTVALGHFVERKYVVTGACGVMVLSMGTLAVYTQAGLAVTSLRWAPQAALALLVAAYGMLWALPTLILVDMLNVEIRVRAMVVVYVYSQMIKLAHTLTLQHIEEYVGVYNLLYICAGINTLAGVYALSTPPAARGRTVRQIERQLRARRVPLCQL